MHTTRDKSKLLARVRRIRGQVEAIERALESETGCSDILQLVAAVRGATNGLMGELIEGHVKEHVANPTVSDDEREVAVDELIAVVRAYLK